jgi:phosphoglycerate dehydrogenase-like enzyme
VFLLLPKAFEDIYGTEDRAAISACVRIDKTVISPEAYHASQTVWPEVEIIFSGWGMVPMDEAFFRRFPRLKVVFYAAGTVREFVTEAFWQREVLLTNAAAANAVPVAEFTLSQILFSLKHGWSKSLYIRRHKKFPPGFYPPGAYRSTVALLSLGEIGTMVAERQKPWGCGSCRWKKPSRFPT